MALWPVSAFSDDEPTHQPAINPAAIVCLHTEYFPWKVREDNTLTYRLMRELGRQAVLIAARDELGLSTRDETLGEPFPESVTQAKKDLHAKIRNYHDGGVRILLWPASAPAEAVPRAEQKSFNPDGIVRLTTKLEEMIRGELRDKLRGLGFAGKVVPPNEANLPPDAVEGQLLEMNFVSQFAAVRAAHSAIAEKGQSRAWLGVLARGYAHLAMMTEDHWKSDNEVFIARALLYSERLSAANAADPLWRAHRAYVRALVGMHGAALQDLDQIEKLQQQPSKSVPLPGWFVLVRPYCSFEREPVASVVVQQKSLRELAQRLSFEQNRAFGDIHWLFKSARETMAICPEEYGVYAALTQSGAPLAVGRTGANYAPAALAHFLPRRIAALPDLPDAVRGAAIGNATAQEEKQSKAKPKTEDEIAPNAPADGTYAAATMPIVSALRIATASGNDPHEPSWSVLGELIFEEQFVQAANYLNIAMNATESSHVDEVKSIMPALTGHRYARYIDSYAVNTLSETTRFNETIGDMQIVDPRANMLPMMRRMWRVDSGDGRNRRGMDASWYAFYDFGLTLPEMLETYSLASIWWDSIDKGMRQVWGDSFRAVSPHAPQTLRLAIILTEKPTYAQASHWESEAGEDPTAYIKVAQIYQQLEHYDDAIRDYERSIELSPSMNAYVGLAGTYRAAGQEELWLPTLQRFFEVEDLGLEHASVHSLIANDLIDKDKWEEAEPHALAAANTWSSSGLELASNVCEGLGRWDESEKWAREDANSYPTYAGDEWYFWCRRTGRGDRQEARKRAQTFFSAEWVKSRLDGQLRTFTFHLLENDARAAFEVAQKFIKTAKDEHMREDDMAFYEMQLALVACELKETAAEQAAIKETRRLGETGREQDPSFSDINQAICDVLEGRTIAENKVDKLDEQLEKKLNRYDRCNYEYFLGRAYDLSGNKDLADKYWKRCVTRGPFDRCNATLAGKYLTDRYKTSRP